MVFARWITLLLVCAALCGCRSAEEDQRANESELQLRVKFEAARRALIEIQARKRQEKPIYADCKTVKLLFLADLKQSASQEARQLAVDLLNACQQASPSEILERQR